MPKELLPADVLKGVRLGISVSDSPDLLRLGLMESHFRLALAEIARAILISGGHLAYGGHIDPNGYTSFLVGELERYSRRDRPLGVYLAWSEHRRVTLSFLDAEMKRIGLLGKIFCLDTVGNEIDPHVGRGDAACPENDPGSIRRSLTALRQHMTKVTQGRVLIGGKRDGFQGEMPGVLEEAILAFDAGQPVYLAGGFGGVTSDITRALDIDGGAWLPIAPDALSDSRLTTGLEKLSAITQKTKRASLDNGLSTEEAARLATSHRPSEIASLVSLGLGRRFSL